MPEGELTDIKPKNMPSAGAGMPEVQQNLLVQSADNPVRGIPAGAVRLVLFFTVLIAAIWATDFLLTFGLRSVETGSFGTANAIFDGEVNVDILISGSSRALVHYDPRIIERYTGVSAYNIGLNGTQTDVQVAWVMSYLNHNKAPRILIHNLDLFSFQVTHDGVYDPCQYIPYVSDEDLYAVLKGIDSDWSLVRYLPMYGYATKDTRYTWTAAMSGLLGRTSGEPTFRGFVPRDRQWTGDFQRFIDANPLGVEFQVEEEGINVMEDLLRRCSAVGIKVILAYSPEYIEMQNIENNRAEIFDRFTKLAVKYDAELWDFSGSLVSYDQQNFYNSQHLNVTGASKFSREFAERLGDYLTQNEAF